MKEDFEIEDCSYSIGPDGSEFYHCTPEILGPSSSSILKLDYGKMWLERIEVFYYLDIVEGQSIPCLKLFFNNKVSGKGICRLVINCFFYWIAPDLSCSTRTKPLPDLNLFTPFSNKDSSLEIKYYWNHVIGNDACDSVYDSSITLKNEYSSLEVNFFDISFEVMRVH